MSPYERLLGDALAGEGLLFARQDGVEEAWRVVDKILTHHHVAHPYPRGTWGPKEADRMIAPVRWLARPDRQPVVTDRDELKQAAGERAVDWVESGMVVGLGTGSTTIFAIRRIGALVQSGELQNVLGIPTSSASEELAREVGIPLTTLAEHPVIDLTIDGADEVDPELNLIKGGGGALLHEKIVAQASLREVIVVDDAKLSPHLGSQHALPVEIVQFAWRPEEEYLADLGRRGRRAAGARQQRVRHRRGQLDPGLHVPADRGSRRGSRPSSHGARAWSSTGSSSGSPPT